MDGRAREGAHLINDSENFRGVYDLLLQVYSTQGDHGGEDGVEDGRLVVKQLISAIR